MLAGPGQELRCGPDRAPVRSRLDGYAMRGLGVVQRKVPACTGPASGPGPVAMQRKARPCVAGAKVPARR